MAKLSIVAGATSQSVNVFIQNSSSTTGAGLTGLAYNTASLIAYYTFAGAAATATSITLATLSAVTSAWSSGGFKELDSTHMPGLYRFDIPNAALASGNGRSVTIYLSGATNMAPCVLEIELTGVDNQDAVHGGMSAIPNASPGTASGILIAGSNAATTISGLTLAGVNASGSTPATAGMTVTGGAASTTSGGTSAAGVSVTGGSGASSTNGASAGISCAGGGTTTVNGGAGLNVQGSGSLTGAVIIGGSGGGHGLFCQSGGGSTGDGIKAASNSTNGNGLDLIGNGTGAGLLCTAGATGPGMSLIGGSSSGDALLTATTSGHGATFAGTGTTKHGINATGGATTSDRIRATGGGTGNGINAQSGSGATGDGIKAQSNATNGNGMELVHNGTGSDLNATTTPLTLAKTTNITGFNDIAATAVVISGAITTSGGKISEVALVDTLTTYTGNTVQTGDAYARLGAPAGVSVSADIAAVKTDTAHLSSECISSSIPSGTPTTGTFIGASGLSSTDNFYQGCMLAFTSGTLKGIARAVSSYTGSSKTFSFTGATGAIDAPFPTAPSTSDTFDILGRGASGT